MFKDSEPEYFAGNFNGNGHTVYGLYKTCEDNDNNDNRHAALFGAVGGGAVIENLRISKAYISSTSGNNYAYFSALAAYKHQDGTLTIRNCVVDNTVQITAKNATIGAFVGYMSDSQNATTTIENCYSGVKISSKKSTWNKMSQACMFVGGITKNASDKVNIKNSYAIGDFKLALSSDTVKPTITNSYTSYSDSNEEGVTVLSKAQMTGAAAKRNMNLLDYENLWYVESGKTPMLQIFCKDDALKSSKDLWNVWNGTVATEFSSGTGTEEDPYVIANGEQLAYLTTTVTPNDTIGKYYKLADDIYLNDVTEDNWYEVNQNLKTWLFKDKESEYFAGNFNGGGHTVYGLYKTGNDMHAALFGAAGGGAVIENLRISKAYISSTSGNNYAYFSALAAYKHQDGTLTIRNCVVDNTVQITAIDASIGAFVGYMAPSAGATTIENCYSGVKISKTPMWDKKPQACMFVGGRPENASSNVNIKNSYAIGDFKLALSSDTVKPTITNSYTSYSDSKEEGVTVLKEDKMHGTAMNALNFEKVWRASDDSLPQLRAFAIAGDVNSDEKVDIRDLVRIKKYLSDSTVHIDHFAANIVPSTKIDAGDLASLRKTLLGINSNFQ